VPYQAARPDLKSRSNDAGTWSHHREAVDALQQGRGDGIGFMLHESDIAAFDLDDCRDRDTGEISRWASELVTRAASYAEITVSGTGLRIIGRASGAQVHRKQTVPGGGSIETYRRAARYIVVTGLHHPPSPPVLGNIDQIIDATVATLDRAKQDSRDRQNKEGSAQSTRLFLDLPHELARVVREGVPEGQRSEQFHRAVAWMQQLGWKVHDIEALLADHPAGIARKYEGRLRREIERCFDKARQSESQEWAGLQGAADHNQLSRFKATPYVWLSPEAIPRREWLYSNHLIRGYVSATVAAGGVGKSALKISEALAMVSGKDLLGAGIRNAPLRVWLWNLEDPRDELQRRIQAAAKYFDLQADDVSGRLFVDTGREQECVIAETTRSGAIIRRPVIENLVSELTRNEIDALIVDPFVSCHRVSENDNNAMDLVSKEWGKVAGRTGSGIDLVHHTRKSGGLESEVTVESSRGGKALTDACRSVVTINRMTKEEAQRAGVDNHRLYFRAFDDKNNLAPPADTSDWYKLESVDLGNGGGVLPSDHVGVARRWDWPDPLQDVTTAHLRAIQEGVSKGQWRENGQARDWVGKVAAKVLALDTDNKAHRSRITALFKVWMANGMFVVVTSKDGKGNDRPFVEVGEWAKD
jgi:hypothetical protein